MKRKSPRSLITAAVIFGLPMVFLALAPLSSVALRPPIRLPTSLPSTPPPTAYSLKGPATPFDAAIKTAAAEYQLDPLLLKAIIAVESEFNPRCVSAAGAAGLMQLLPSTARLLHVKDIFDPAENIHGGARHFHYLLQAFSNDLSLSLAAYNAGMRPVLTYKGIPPYAETKDYVRQVLKIYKSYRSS